MSPEIFTPNGWDAYQRAWARVEELAAENAQLRARDQRVVDFVSALSMKPCECDPMTGQSAGPFACWTCKARMALS